MKITYIHQYFTTPEMVGGTRSFEFARRFVDWGHEVTVISAWTEPSAQRDWFVTNEAGVTVRWLPVRYANEMSYRQRMVAFIRFATSASAWAARTPADVVFATSTPLTVAIPGVRAARARRAPLVFEVRDLWPAVPIALGALGNPVLRWAAHRLERWAYRNSECVVALSPGMRDGVVAAGFPRERVAVVPNSSDLGAFDDPSLGAVFRGRRPGLGERPLVLYAGALGRANGVHVLVDIAAALRETAPDIRFLIVGDGYDRDAVRAKARAANVLDTTLFIEDPLPKRDVMAAFAAADLTACLFIDAEPLWTGSPNKLFDSLAAGTPVFLNYGGWQADLIMESGAGVVSVGESAGAAAQRIEGFLRNTQQRSDAGRRAKTLALERFDRDDHARQVLRVLERAVDRKGEAAAEVTPRWS